MRKRIISALAIAACAVGGLQAREFRAPLVGLHGPLRYDVYKKKDKWTLDLWSMGHSKNATKAYLKHGTESHDLAALMFGKANFKASEAFSPEAATEFTENFNLNLNSTMLTPRVTYNEQGMVLGGRFEYPVWQNKGRVGVRAAIPFKTVRVERDNDAETVQSGDQRNVIVNDNKTISIPTDLNNAQPGGHNRPMGTKNTIAPTKLYRLSFVRDIPFNVGGQIEKFVRKVDVEQLGGGHGGDLRAIAIAGTPYNAIEIPAAGQRLSDNATYAAENIPFVFAYTQDANKLPHVRQRAIRLQPNVRQHFGNADAEIVALTDNDANRIRGKVVAAGPGLTTAIANNEFGERNNFAANRANANSPLTIGNLLQINGQIDAAKRADTLSVPRHSGGGATIDATYNEIMDNADNFWLVTTHNHDGTLLNPATVAALDGYIARYGEESTEQWLYRNGYSFMTHQRTGMGDIDVDAFYEHDFNEDWRGEVCLGIKLPTGGSSDYAGNPYKANPLLGNGNHFEIKLGANVGWATPWDWLNVHAGASYAFAIEATEQRPAAFKGATVYGIGPKVDADVDWGYFTGNLNATVFHRKTDDLSTTFGYEVYYKTEDNVSFKKAKLKNDEAWFGKQWDNAAGNFGDFEHELDNKVAQRNTERIAHRFRFESHWHAHKYMSLFMGGAFTFAGQNIAREADMHGGMKVRF